MDRRNKIKEQFLTTFIKEWELYKGGESTPHNRFESERAGNFDFSPKAGELRLFAESNRPLVGLLYKRLDDGWIVMPVSEFSVPATEQEILIENRVYQLWNAFTASNGFALKSYLVDVVPDNDMKDICEAMLHVAAGDPLREDMKECMGLPITSIEDPRLDYEREFASGMAFEEESQSIEMGHFTIPESWLMAAIEEDAPYRLAAATSSESSFMLLLENASKDAIRKTCIECELAFPFVSINPGDEPDTLVFRPKSLPKGWNDKVDVPVQARNRKTLELVGEGVLEAATGEIAVRTTGKVSESIGSPDQLVLVMVRNEA